MLKISTKAYVKIFNQTKVIHNFPYVKIFNQTK